MLTIVATPGDSNANAYVTEADAAAFLEERLHTEAWTTWDPTSDEMSLVARRRAALVTATRLLDEQVQWHGTPVSATQALAWPQHGQVDAYGRPIASTVVPVAIQRATAYLALALLRDTSEDPAQATLGAIKSKRLGDTEIVYRDHVAGDAPGVRLPAEVRRLVQPYGTVSGGMTVPLVRV